MSTFTWMYIGPPTLSIRRAELIGGMVTDLASGAFDHDGCPITAVHVANAVKAARKNDTYVLAKASRTQKIDAAMADVLAHEARADALAAGWTDAPTETYFQLPR